MKVIELSGLPGCGKTTLTQEVIAHLNHYRILTYKDVMSFGTCSLPFLGFFLDFLSFKYLKTNVLLARYACSYPFKIERLKFMKTLITFNKALHEIMLAKEVDFIVLEEGLLQLLTSIPHENEIQVNGLFLKLMNALMNLKPCDTFLFVHCFLEKEEVIQRLRLRNKPNDRFDALPLEIVDKRLEIKLKNLTIVQKIFQAHFKSLTLDMNKNNVELVMSELFKK